MPDLFDGPWPLSPLRPEGYRCILADPPWRFANWSDKGEVKNATAHYACMALADIEALPVARLAHPEGAALVMWATAPLLPAACRLMDAWGFTFKSAGAWAKQSSTGRAWAFGTGYCYRSAAEFYLLGTRGRGVRAQSRSVRNLIVAPVREHSRKPDAMRRDLEAMFPGPRAELFAREAAPGWDAWGNETTKFSSVEAA